MKNAAPAVILTALAVVVLGANSAAVAATRERPVKDPVAGAETESSIRSKCIAEAATLAPAEMERRRANLIQLCVEKKGKM